MKKLTKQQWIWAGGISAAVIIFVIVIIYYGKDAKVIAMNAQNKIAKTPDTEDNKTTTGTTLPPAKVLNKGDRVQVTASSLNVRSGGSTSASILTSVPKGTLLTVDDYKNGWIMALYAPGKSGWLYTGYLTKVSAGYTWSGGTDASANTPPAAGSGFGEPPLQGGGYEYQWSS